MPPPNPALPEWTPFEDDFPVAVYRWGEAEDTIVKNDGAKGDSWQQIAAKINPLGVCHAWMVAVRWFYLTHPRHYGNTSGHHNWLPVEDYVCRVLWEAGFEWNEMLPYLPGRNYDSILRRNQGDHHLRVDDIWDYVWTTLETQRLWNVRESHPPMHQFPTELEYWGSIAEEMPGKTARGCHYIWETGLKNNDPR